MEIRIKQDSVEIEGYVNAVERNSKPLHSRVGKFIERICKGAFQRAIDRSDDIKLKLNHERVIGGTADGTLELTEDAIGLKARAIVTDQEVVEDARNGRLRGWSFGFLDVPDGIETRTEDGLPLRVVKDMNLKEVSIVNDQKSPAYEGTLIMARSDDEIEFYGETMTDEMVVREEPENIEERSQQEKEPPEDNKVIDYSKYEEMVSEMKGETINE